MIDLYTKGKGGKISENLWAVEMDCKCSFDDCTFTIVDKKLAFKWARFRANFSSPITVTSGFRCQRHNANVGGHPNSRHKKGQALDLLIPKGHTIESFAAIARSYFEKVILYPEQGFIHVNVE